MYDARLTACSEITLFVKHTVIGKVLLAADCNAALLEHAGNVVQPILLQQRVANNGGDAGNILTQRFNRGIDMLHEMWPQQQVFRGITGQCQLGKYNRVCGQFVTRTLAGRQYLTGIAVNITDQIILLRHDDA